MHGTPTTPARPTTPIVQLDEDTIRNAGIELDDDPFARVEGVRMLKPAEKGKARSVEYGVDDRVTDMGRGMTRWRVFRPIVMIIRRSPVGVLLRVLRM